MPDPITTHDDQHRELARGAMEHAHRALESDMLDLIIDGEALGADVITEALSAWTETGLMPEALSDRETREVCAAIAGRVATVLVMVGWQPPARLLTDTTIPTTEES